MPQDKPTPPDATFSQRFAKAGIYGFFLFDTDTDQTLTDVLSDDQKYVILIVGPQSLSVREPFATAVTPTQGGGLVVESRGGILKYGQLSGTTAYLPLNRDDGLHIPPFNPRSSSGVLSAVQSVVPGIEQTVGSIVGAFANTRSPIVYAGAGIDALLGARSGFLAFYKLRNLFRLYEYNRRIGNTSMGMHWFDVKGEDFWRIEPQDFTMNRQARRPFLYDYNINFQFIEVSQVHPPDDAVTVAGVSMPSSSSSLLNSALSAIQDVNDLTQALGNASQLYTSLPILNSISRLTDLGGALSTFVNSVAGSVQNVMQSALSSLNAVTSFFTSPHSAATATQAIPLATLTQLSSSIDTARAVLYAQAPTEIQEEMNEWCCEVKQLTYGLISYHLATFNQSPGNDATSMDQNYSSGRGKAGFTTDLMQTLPGSTGALDNNPILGVSGLGLVTDVDALKSTQAVRAVAIQSADTIYSLAMRYLGDIRRAIDLIILNGLDAPYIVADPSDKPNNTLAWGEFINIPATATDTGVEAQHLNPLVPSFNSDPVTAITTLTLTDSEVEASDWEDGQWIGYTVTLTHVSTGVTETRICVDNDDAGTVTINYAWNSPAAIGDTFTLVSVLFNPARPTTDDVKAFGQDFLLSFDSNNQATIVMNSQGDAAQVQGMDNFMQAMNLRALTEPGGIPWHRSYGLSWPIGTKWNLTNAIMFASFAKQSFLADPRVSSVTDAQMQMSGDVFAFSAAVTPINSNKARSIAVSK